MPEEPLGVPPQAEDTDCDETAWNVVARNGRINKNWEELMESFPENTARCYKHLRCTPLSRRPGRIFPLRGKEFKGSWEYELTSGHRVFYVPDPHHRKVTVYYVGKHPKETPTP